MCPAVAVVTVACFAGGYCNRTATIIHAHMLKSRMDIASFSRVLCSVACLQFVPLCSCLLRTEVIMPFISPVSILVACMHVSTAVLMSAQLLYLSLATRDHVAVHSPRTAPVHLLAAHLHSCSYMQTQHHASTGGIDNQWHRADMLPADPQAGPHSRLLVYYQHT